MFGNYQSSNQANIAQNNVDSKVSNSTTNLTKSTLLAVNSTALENIGEVAGNMNLSGNCRVTQNNSATSDSSQNLSSIATTNTSFDNNLSTNITNDLQADLDQSTPGLSGGYLSAQMNSQVNDVSNSVQNSIRNASYISRETAISNIKQDNQTNTWHVGGDFTCSGDASFSQGNTVSQKSLQNLKSNTNDKYSVVNDITTALDNSLTTKASQGGSIMMYIAIIVMAWLFMSPKSGAHATGLDVYTTFAKSAVLLTFIHWELIQYVRGRDPTDDNWYAYWNNSFMWTRAVPTSWVPQIVADNSFGLLESPTICMGSVLRGMASKTQSEQDLWETKCVGYYDKVSKWKDTWKDETIRNHISINGEGGVSITDRQYNCGNSGGCETCEFPLVDGICQKDDIGDGLTAAQKDFKYEELLKISLGCTHLDSTDRDDETVAYVNFTSDMMSWHHETYLWDDAQGAGGSRSRPGTATSPIMGGKPDFQKYANKKPIIRHDPDKISPKEMSVQIIQPGVGYLTDTGYTAQCKRKKKGKVLQDIVSANAKKTEDRHDTEYEEWGSCCAAGSNCPDITVSLRGDSSCSSSTAAINKEVSTGQANSGMGCWRSSGSTTNPDLSTLLGNLAMSVSEQGQVPGTPILCEYSEIGSVEQSLSLGVFGCSDDKNDNPCTPADNCSANFLTHLVTADDAAAGNTPTPSQLSSADVQSMCPSGAENDCGFSVGGVTHIVIDEVPDDHKLDPNNMYKIVSDASTKQQIYLADPTEHKVTWATNLRDPPTDRNSLIAGKGSLGIWSTSAAIQTSNYSQGASNWTTADGSNTICVDKGGGHIHDSKKWPEMGNPCETTFKLNPLVTQSTKKDEKRAGTCNVTDLSDASESSEIACISHTETECDADPLCTYNHAGTINVASDNTVLMGCGGFDFTGDLLTRCQCEPDKGEDGGDSKPVPINIIEVFTPLAGSGMDFWWGLMYLWGPPLIFSTVITFFIVLLGETPVRRVGGPPGGGQPGGMFAAAQAARGMRAQGTHWYP